MLEEPTPNNVTRTYRVNLARVHWFSVDIQAENEDVALDLAYDIAPGVSAHESGWGQEWGVDADEWIGAEEMPFPSLELKTVELVEDDDA